MAKGKENKTNVMRVLDSLKLSYISHNYVESGTTVGMEVAKILHQDPKNVFKRSEEHTSELQSPR